MSNVRPIALAWGGGKDSAMALHRLREDDRYQVVCLLSTITTDFNRVSMHGIRRKLLIRQVEELGLPLMEVTLTKDADSNQYDRKMEEAMRRLRQRGIRGVAFGDIHLEDVRRYREERISSTGMEAVFPLWGQDTESLAREFVDLGFGAVVVCVDGRVLCPSLVGRDYDMAFLADLPTGVDPCGENGEFHTFVYKGPTFRRNVSFTKGEIVKRDGGFYFCDLLPA